MIMSLLQNRILSPSIEAQVHEFGYMSEHPIVAIIGDTTFYLNKEEADKLAFRLACAVQDLDYKEAKK